jgi:hypothetical protein
MASARAMATRWRWPPESSRGHASTLSASPTRPSSARADASAFSRSIPRTTQGASVTLSSAVRCG